MAMCEDYPCCGHTDGLGCDYTPDMTAIYAHALCDHEVGECRLDSVDEDDYCEECGLFMNYSQGVENVDYVYYYALAYWDGKFSGARYQCAHWACVPEGSALCTGAVSAYETNKG